MYNSVTPLLNESFSVIHPQPNVTLYLPQSGVSILYHNSARSIYLCRKFQAMALKFTYVLYMHDLI